MVVNTFILVLAFAGLVQALLLSLYLLRFTQGNRRANTFLAMVLLGLTIRIGKSVLNYYLFLAAWQQNIGIAGIFIAGPALWLYGIALIEKEKQFSNLIYLHFSPFVIFILLFAVIPSNGVFATFWNYGLVVFHLAVYLILSWKYLFGNRSKTSSGIFAWYRNMLIGVSLVWLYYLGNLLSYNLYYVSGPLFYTFLIYAFTYLFLNRHHFSLEKYRSSNLDKHTSTEVYQVVKALFASEQPFTDPELSLQSLAKKLVLSPRVLSQVINENEDRNFHEFVNRYRVEKAKELLADPVNEDQKIATLGFDSGFGTVTSFNTAFRKITGMTPSEYRKLHRL
jgi:AraC-like DNA-binding protein